MRGADTDHTDVQGLDDYVPPPYVPPTTLDERLATVWREVTRTPTRAAMAALDVCALLGFIASLRTIPVTAVDAQGPLRANCGISFYLSRASNQSVDTACRYAFSSRIPQLILFGGAFLVLTALLVRAITRRDREGSRPWRALVATPARAGLAVFDLAALVTVIVALQPVTVATSDANGGLAAHCGFGYFAFGAPVASVDRLCRSAYGPRATLFLMALLLLAGGVTALLWSARRRPARVESHEVLVPT